ncbi:hypothetical protein KIL84_022262 [Mauremys mutica]|uniref:Uncharacterized protein n=1 Tax=Mauremys mutica TaxID=74926 RepID=A0A9D4ATJ8_9SAUR|nr:hypothetical protein KIL84_022262 [Mauremys mutica]
MCGETVGLLEQGDLKVRGWSSAEARFPFQSIEHFTPSGGGLPGEVQVSAMPSGMLRNAGVSRLLMRVRRRVKHFQPQEPCRETSHPTAVWGGMRAMGEALHGWALPSLLRDQVGPKPTRLFGFLLEAPLFLPPLLLCLPLGGTIASAPSLRHSTAIPRDKQILPGNIA